ncbi:MAG: gliding motility-associated ABC transporter permease subunit GldF [Leadbetterella sp.]
MISIYKKELRVFFNSIIGYVVIGVFLGLTGLLFWVYPTTNILDFGYADMSMFFQLCPYVFLFLIPAVTMKMFSEEFRLGTLELLLTKPISTFQLVSGKFFASLTIVVLALIPTLVYYFSLHSLGNPQGNIDTASVMGSYLGTVFLAASFTALGILASTLFSNQIVSFIVAALLCYTAYDGIPQVAGLMSNYTAYLISLLGLSTHFESLSRGMLDSRDIVFYISFSALFLLLAAFVLNKRREAK